MPTQITSTETAEHYKWGGPHGTDCDGWHLVKTTDLSIIEELMPPGAQEERHFHAKARQFFFVLEGELSMEWSTMTSCSAPVKGLRLRQANSIKP
jgi:mannose-6-phosphate isomerase-like protein (cupin superfamily)